jgi:alpha-D-xyloside xylohydrolase
VENRYVRAQQLFDQTQQENDDLKEWRELQTRWNQFGCFIPLYRAHGQWPLREVWNIAPAGHPAYESIVWYHRLRYHLMPYLYSMAGWVHLKDYTMMRALVMDFNGDEQVYDLKDQWMFGPSLMACPVSEYKARTRTVYFPKQRGWYDLYTGKQIVASQTSNLKSSTLNRRMEIDAPYERIPVFVPEGSILPIGPAMEWSDEKPAELIHLYVYAGRDAQFLLYEDEGTNYNYEKGQYSTIDIRYNEQEKTLTLGKRNGKFEGMLKERRFNIVFVTPANAQPLNLDSPKGKTVTYNGKAITIRL